MPAISLDSSRNFHASGTEIHKRTYGLGTDFNSFERHILEDEFQPELNQPRICPGSRAGYDPEVPIVRGAANGVGRRELSPKLEAEPVVGGKPCSLEQGEVEIIHSLRAQSGIHARLISESEVRRCRKTRGVEPSRCVQIIWIPKLCSGGSGHRRRAAGHKVRAGTSAKKCGAVELSVRKDQRESSLEYGDAVNAPSPYYLF